MPSTSPSATPPPSPAASPTRPPNLGRLALRSALGGTLMGMANLVPGISGGTMLLAAGVYPRFIEAVSQITTLKLGRASLTVLGTVVATALLAIVLLARPVEALVVGHRWMMYSLFIGLTLGGVPVVWKLIRRADRRVWLGAAAGLVAMVLLTLAQREEPAAASQTGHQTVEMAMLFLAGVAGASAMILPGVSGAYLLLVLGYYIPILSAIGAFKEALLAGDLAAATDPAVRVMLPVGLGVIAGVMAVSHLLRWLLLRYEKATLGVLLGLLVGAVVGLWPFQEGVPPAVGTVIKGQVVTEENLGELDPADYPVRFFTPTAGQVACALGLILAGGAATGLVARFGKEEGAVEEIEHPAPGAGA